MRTIDATTQTALNTGIIFTAHLVHVSLRDSLSNVDYNVYMTDYNIDLTYNNNTYLAGGHLLSVNNITDTSDLQINDVTVGLSGIDSQRISEVLQYDYIDRPLRIYRVFLNRDDVVLSANQLFYGRINAPAIQDNVESGDMIVTINASSYLSDFDKKSSRHTNQKEHQYYHPNDNFFNLWGKIDKEIIWGYEE